MLVLFGTMLITTIVHEQGHALILRAAGGGKPKITINLFKGSRTVAFIPRERKREIQALSAFNAVAFGLLAITFFMLGAVVFIKSVEFLPALFGLIVYYVLGIKKDMQNVFKWVKEK